MEHQYVPITDVIADALRILKPPPDITVAEWADRYRYLSQEASAMPGRYKTETTEYMREPMEMVGAPGVRRITMMTSAQVAKSTFLENVIGFFMHQDPCPILHVSPTLSSMKMFSKERLAPMIRDTPVLRNIVKEAKSRDSGNTLDSKIFPGGHIAMVGANAPAGLASRPVRVVVFDEVDRFEASAGTEGDPIALAIKRTTTFWNRVVITVSTPGNRENQQTNDKDSRIEPEYLAGDQRQRWCPCPHCGEYQVLKWSQVQWDHGEPDTAMYYCEHCGAGWDDTQRNVAVRAGEWRAQKPWNGHASYHLSQIYSPFALLSDGVREFLAAKHNPQLLKTWVNTFLGETWEEKGERLEWSNLMDQREEYEIRDPIPEEVTLITVGVDMQDDRAEIEWVGWGDDYRSWSLGYRPVYGDPSAPEFWSEVDAALSETFIHQLFGEMSPRSIAFDSGGHYTQAVYDFAEGFPRCVAIKGVPGFGKPMVGRPMKNTLGNARVIPLGVDTIKEIVVSRLKQTDPDGAGYCTFHAEYEEPYFQGLTAEEIRTKYRKGFATKEWVKIRARNEPFDCRVYATAALEMLEVDLNAQRRFLLHEIRNRDNPATEEPAPSRRRRVVMRKSSWAERWKND
jgi:phage terminase large subunit GpA-like protein